ncbi:MAG: hypothetical protein PWP49_520 [Thermococcaceae archaeon]|nr:hypothetical protein [Thermococcaceae archaeon]MDN5320100.1 hypothetical protein [Thermococcaceae archaeon]
MFNLSKAHLKKVNPSGGERKSHNQKRKNLFSMNSAIGVAIDDMHHQKIKGIWGLKSLPNCHKPVTSVIWYEFPLQVTVDFDLAEVLSG